MKNNFKNQNKMNELINFVNNNNNENNNNNNDDDEEEEIKIINKIQLKFINLTIEEYFPFIFQSETANTTETTDKIINKSFKKVYQLIFKWIKKQLDKQYDPIDTTRIKLKLNKIKNELLNSQQFNDLSIKTKIDNNTNTKNNNNNNKNGQLTKNELIWKRFKFELFEILLVSFIVVYFILFHFFSLNFTVNFFYFYF
jgi:hypothetical protein